MTHKHMEILGLVLVILLGAVPLVSGEVSQTLVFKDGSTIEAISLTIVRGAVVVELPDGRMQQFEKRDIDLQASGLVPETRSNPAPTSKKPTPGRLVMPADLAENQGLTITDQDVGHVDKSKKKESDQDAESDTDEQEEPAIPLRISGVRHFMGDTGVTVTGSVTNDGINDLEKTTVTGVAVDAYGRSLGQGTVSLASVLPQGGTTSFSMIIPVTGEVQGVRISASASEIMPERPQVEGVDAPEDSQPHGSGDQTSGTSAG